MGQHSLPKQLKQQIPTVSNMKSIHMINANGSKRFIKICGDKEGILGTASRAYTNDKPRGEFRPRQTRQLPRTVDLKGRLLNCQSY